MSKQITIHMDKEHAKELLYKQLELLAEQSKSADASELPRITDSMCRVYELLFAELAEDASTLVKKLKSADLESFNHPVSVSLTSTENLLKY